MLDKEYKYFKSHQSELVKKYPGLFIVIVGEDIVGAYTTERDAYNSAKSSYKLGTFLIQHCIAGETAYSQTFHSSAYFA